MILMNMEAVDQNFIALGPLYKGVAMKHHVQKNQFSGSPANYLRNIFSGGSACHAGATSQLVASHTNL